MKGSLFWQVATYIWCYPPNRGQRLRRLCLAVFWQLHKRLIGLPLIYRLDNGFRFVAYPQSIGASYAFYVSEYDYPFIRFHRSWLSGQGTILDVGANIGLYALSLATHCKSAILVEPDPVAFEMMRENVELNRLASAFRLFQFAAGDECKDVFLSQQDTGWPSNKVSANDGLPVRQLTVDEILRSPVVQDSPRVEFVKIDVEGYELNVLQGMTSLIDGPSPPCLIQFERLAQTPIQPLLEFFQVRGWTVFAVGPDCRPSTALSAIHGAHDLMATPLPLLGFDRAIV